ncbi:hypothetical protein TVAG_367070 [Trichomonas vaginalis G3]|uniref:DUF3447 domain-containing protein n=1 Tax=Trichomonas vaginalis (strain ATCC PRA-98 / G3) TaxID=412133 RepID=A2G575_TRIV3|nr:spectrin binding [Trichomonas vaginalis G3]EAX87695.1 hypothetical protein TVAG_367070 [Trichomonas vaginalis G3]KAI5495270.1 spectrin binding [Trichomonas vaginalis G3]|eukprot:XP_001300625.1 hypothetical protein [Trichomonas vaginalis G3]
MEKEFKVPPIKRMNFLEKYRDFIETYEKLYQMKADESIEVIFNCINLVLINKYKIPPRQIIFSIIRAIHYNYRCMEQYVIILNKIVSKYSLICKYLLNDIIENKDLGKIMIQNPKKVVQSNQFYFDENSFSKENEIDYIIMHDQIDKFREYSVEKTLNDVLIKIHTNSSVSLIEACCYYGSVNIFYFLISNTKSKITKDCLHYSIIGGNTDIINECLKNNKIAEYYLNEIVSCHNNKLLEYIFNDKIFQPKKI